MSEEELVLQRMQTILQEHQEYLQLHTLSGGVGLYPHVFEKDSNPHDDISFEAGFLPPALSEPPHLTSLHSQGNLTSTA